MIAPTALAIVSYYSTGDWNGYCQIKWQSPIQAPGTFPMYRIEWRSVVSGLYGWLADVPPGQGEYTGISVRIATAPSGGNPKTLIVNQVRITAIDASGNDATPGVATITIPPLAPTHNAASNFAMVCRGEIGEPSGGVDVNWTDLSQFIRNGRITLSKYGVTSPGIARVLYDSTFTGVSSLYGPNKIHIDFDLFPPGLKLDPVLWDPYDPPSNDPRAPFWVIEGDLLTLIVATSSDDDSSQKVAEFTFSYRRAASISPFLFRFRRFTGGIVPYQDWAWVGIAYSTALEIVQDPFLPSIAMVGAVAYVSGLPAGLSYNPSTKIISGTPTGAPGQYEVLFDITSTGNFTKQQSFFLDVGVPGPAGIWPQIQSPPSPVALLRGSYIPQAYRLVAPGQGNYSIVSGFLPAGVTLDAATGIFNGVPTNIEASHDVVFKKEGTPGSFGPNYTVSFVVGEGRPPTVTMDNIIAIKLYELVSIPIVTDFVAFAYRSLANLPPGLSIQGGTITGVADAPPGNYPCSVQAGNIFGWGPLFQFLFTVNPNPPEIFSSNSVEAIINENFVYQIIASNEPVYFGADGLPDGLEFNAFTGVISGVPTGLSSAYLSANPESFKTGDPRLFTLQHTIKLSAVNNGGAGTLDLALTVRLPDVPVIDTSALNGRAISLDVNEVFTFQPSASNDPTSWSAEPLPTGLSFDTVSGRLSGQFITSGFYGITFVASNAGGGSDPVTFYFLVGVAAQTNGTPPPPTRVPIDVVSLWVDLDTGFVSVDSSTQSDAMMTVKRGDTIVTNVIFHQQGVPTNINLTALYFGAKVAFDDDYVVYSTQFSRITDGQYKTYPDFSDQNNELDSLLTTDQAQLIGEIQWDLADGTRHSTQTFGIVVLRDLLHPDPILP